MRKITKGCPWWVIAYQEPRCSESMSMYADYRASFVLLGVQSFVGAI